MSSLEQTEAQPLGLQKEDNKRMKKPTNIVNHQLWIRPLLEHIGYNSCVLKFAVESLVWISSIKLCDHKIAETVMLLSE